MSTQTRLMTADEFLEMPDDGVLHELVRGEVVTMSLPGGRHGKITLKIGRLIGGYVEEQRLGDTYAAETGFLIEHDPDTVRGADVAFVRAERLSDIINLDKHIPFAPDLAVEVLSPNDRAEPVEEKVQEWLAAGSQAVWVADPATKTVTVHRRGAAAVTLSENQEISADDILPGFRCLVAEFFA